MEELDNGGIVLELKEVLVTVTCIDGCSRAHVFPDVKSALDFVKTSLFKYVFHFFEIRIIPVVK